jgi:peptide/nickel transport system permease protein
MQNNPKADPISTSPQYPDADPSLIREASSAAPVAPIAGQLITPKAPLELEVDQALERSAADRKAQGQALTGRAARLSAISLSPTQLALRRLRKNRLAVFGGWVLIVMYAMAILAPFIAPYGFASQDPDASYRPPMRIHLSPWPTAYASVGSYNEYRERIYKEDTGRPIRLRFFARGEPYKLLWLLPTRIHLFGFSGGDRVYVLGTDQFGRDYFSRMLYAAQISLSVGLIGIAITLGLGLIVGGISGFYGGRIDEVIMRVCEIIMSVPDFYLLLALAATLPPTLPPAVTYILIIGILSFVGWAGMARIIRGMVLSVREREYVEAARALGVPDAKIIRRHILPSTFTFAIVAATLSIPAYILGEASLSFLGLGIKDPMPSWGNMLSAAQTLSVLESKYWILIPGFLIFLTTLAFNFLGDGLRDAFDPKAK